MCPARTTQKDTTMIILTPEEVIEASKKSRDHLAQLSEGDIRIRDLEIALAVSLVLSASQANLLKPDHIELLMEEFEDICF